MDEPLDILKLYWGFDSFRVLQEEVITAVLHGADTLALMPTGGGKSICYQVPALCRPGLCLVISPLIALMKDQVSQLKKRNIPAAAIYSGMHYKEIDRTLDNCVYGGVKLLYLSPERLLTEIVRERLQRMEVNLIAVDEAHCISQWGYDFRPAYLQIAELRTLLPETPVLALTATATKEVVRDIQEKLEFKALNAFQMSFQRANLSYSILFDEGKMNKLNDIVRKVSGSGIVYVRNRRKTREIAQFLQRRGQAADYYHAGLTPEKRSAKQEAWMSNKTRIIVSTNAFGMGIDKPDVRFVVHVDLPDSLEAYFQEAGRAGRDGEKAFAVLLYQPEDRRRLEKQFAVSFPEEKEMRRVYRALGSFFQLAIGAGEGESFDFDLTSFCKNFDLEPVKTFHCLKNLEKAGWILLSEAVFIPSSLKIKVDKDVLYDFQLKHPKLDRLLKVILRSYQGAFQHPIYFREQQLAYALKSPLEMVKSNLLLLSKHGIIDYKAQKDQPQLVFLRERVDANNLTIDREMYQFRKENASRRLKRTIQYVESPICRSNQLIAYFGETTEQRCGICDVCLGRTKSDLDDATYKKLKTKIFGLLRRDQLKLEEIVDSFSPKWRDRVLKTMEYLVDEGAIDKKDEIYFVK